MKDALLLQSNESHKQAVFSLCILWISYNADEKTVMHSPVGLNLGFAFKNYVLIFTAHSVI